MNIHPPSLVAGFGLAALVGISLGQQIVGAPGVQVVNPLGVPGWVPSGVWMAGGVAGDFTVPVGHFALVRSLSASHSGGSGGRYVQVDEGGGFYPLAAIGYAGGVLEPGVVVDEGAVIGVVGNDLVTVHGYLIPK